MVVTALRQLHAGEVNASNFVRSPVANAVSRSVKNSRAAAVSAAVASLDDRAVGSEAAELGDVPALVGLEGALELSATDGVTEGAGSDTTGLLDVPPLGSTDGEVGALLS